MDRIPVLFLLDIWPARYPSNPKATGTDSYWISGQIFGWTTLFLVTYGTGTVSNKLINKLSKNSTMI
jgi:hypothetical protein